MLVLVGSTLVGAALAGTTTVHVLDVGQGDAILIEAPDGSHILIDAGKRGPGVVDDLEAMGVDDLELVVASHPHADHIGGMQEVVEAFDIELYIDSGLEHTTKTYRELMLAVESRDIEYKKAVRGQEYDFGELHLDILWPGNVLLRNTRSDLNSNSVVVRAQHGDTCFLFTGDAEEPTERGLLNNGLEPCQVLKVAHHGSDHSTTSAFARAVQPEVALISTGLGNRYKHPGLEALGHLDAEGALVYRTDLWGILSVQTDGKTYEVIDGMPADPDMGWVPKDHLGSTGRTVGPSPDIPRPPRADAPSEDVPAETPAEVEPTEAPNLSGVRPSTGADEDVEDSRRGLIQRIKDWIARRRARRASKE
ncbi:MAG: MBL fold metallo-hydrolase [Proteobacteria bacterium]|nr:MBL fold metallo-hydrolase [Pseudomonadota bacterium]MCP4917854.1 MBL fold metallo-hydrolase [Pseudomonadota bacterium]